MTKRRATKRPTQHYCSRCAARQDVFRWEAKTRACTCNNCGGNLVRFSELAHELKGTASRK